MSERIPFAFRLAAYHFAASSFVAALGAFFVFFIWYPNNLHQLTGVTTIFLILLGVDVCVGPLLTLIISSPKKGARERLIDFSIIAIVQISALLYGMHTVFVNRPVFVVYNVGRFDLVSANEIDNNDKASEADPAFKKTSIFGPKYVGALLPTADEEKSKMTLSALEGGADLPQMPKYYVAYDSVRSELIKVAAPIESMKSVNLSGFNEIMNKIKDLKKEPSDVGFLIVKVRNNFFTALVDKKTGNVIYFFKIKSWGK